MTFFSSLKSRLTKTSNAIKSGISSVFASKYKNLDDLDALEDALLMADCGDSSMQIVDELKKVKYQGEPTITDVSNALVKIISEKLTGSETEIKLEHSPTVLMFCGVNGNGKTTTCGKLAKQYIAQGKRVLIVACDTFRAAAVEQLEVWCERSKCDIHKGAENADPASVAYSGIKRATDEGYDVVMIDTAGRLHNKQNLMDELGKIVRVIKKHNDSYPHYSILVLDGTTGQNTLQQVEVFKSIVNINAIIVTKLDSTAKGGFIVPLYTKHKIPIAMIGIGEKVEDLAPFHASEFAHALLD